MNLLDRIEVLNELMRVEEYSLLKNIRNDKILLVETKKSLSELIQRSIDFLDALDPIEDRDSPIIRDTRC